MSLYTVTIDNREYQVEVRGDRSTVNGKVVHTRIVPLNQSGLHMLRGERRVLELFLNVLEGEKDAFEMLLHGGTRIVTRIADRRRVRAQAREGQKPGNLCAPMHGLVVEVLAGEGQRVEKGQTLVVLESMKMQMQLRATQAGAVARVPVRRGQQVEKGSVLLEFEAPTKENS